jgi:hypothetical protein
MQQDKTNSLFDVRLNQDGITAIKKFAKAANWVMLLVIIIASISFIDAFTHYYQTYGKSYTRNKMDLFMDRIYPAYVLIYFLLAFSQTYNFLKTAKRLSAAIDNNDEGSFNRSFFTYTEVQFLVF